MTIFKYFFKWFSYCPLLQVAQMTKALAHILLKIKRTNMSFLYIFVSFTDRWYNNKIERNISKQATKEYKWHL